MKRNPLTHSLPTVPAAKRWLNLAIGTVLALSSWTLRAQPATEADVPEPVYSVSGDSGQQLFSFKAINLDVRQALALFADANGLNIIPDQEVTGNVTAAFRDLPLELAMEALLSAHGYYFVKKDGLIRVRSLQTRIFHVNYIDNTRAAAGSNDVQFSSKGSESSGGGSSDATEGSTMRLSSNSDIDFWKSLSQQLESLASPQGKITVNRLAGIVSVTDLYPRVQEIQSFLENVESSVTRQVELEVEIYEVTLSESSALGIDWSAVSDSLQYGVNVPLRVDSSAVIGAGASGTFTATYDATNNNSDVILEALKQQGDLKVVSKPKLRTLNNQPSVIRIGQDLPVFRQNVTIIPGDNPIFQNEEEIQTVTIGTVLSIVPQISRDGYITLDVSPAISRLIRNEVSAATQATAPVIDVRQASSIVRIKDGESVVLGGLVQTQDNLVERSVPFLGDIPLIGKAFRGTRSSKVESELVIIVTPKIVK